MLKITSGVFHFVRPQREAVNAMGCGYQTGSYRPLSDAMTTRAA
jgi:hypothetical protein